MLLHAAIAAWILCQVAVVVTQISQQALEGHATARHGCSASGRLFLARDRVLSTENALGNSREVKQIQRTRTPCQREVLSNSACGIFGLPSLDARSHLIGRIQLGEVL